MSIQRRWLPLLGLALVLGALIRSPLLVIFAATLGVMLGVILFWRRNALRGVQYRRRWTYRRLFPGETTPLRIEIANNKFLPLSWLTTADPWPRAVGPEDETRLAPTHVPSEGLLTHVFSLRWFERTHRDQTLRFRKRGIYSVGPAVLESGDLFGMTETQAEAGGQEYLTVYPTILPMSALRLDAEDPFGDRRSRRRLFEDPAAPVGVRDYQPHDDFRRVHWPATARTGQLQVKVYQPVSVQTLLLCLNVSTLPHYWQGVDPERLELLVQVTATLAQRAVDDGYAVGLISNGCLAHSDQPFRIPPSRSPQQLASLLQALAGVTAFTTAPFEAYLYRTAGQLSYGATLVVITGMVRAELSETLVRMSRYRLHQTLIAVADEAPVPIPGVRVLHRPPQELV